MKTLEKLLVKAGEKGHAKTGAWEIEQVQGEFIRLKHYGSLVCKIDFTTSPVSFVNESTSMSDSRGANWLLKQFRLNTYTNNLKGFREWLRDCPTLFSGDDVPGSHSQTYNKDTKIYTEILKRKSFMSDDILEHSGQYVYNQETGRFQSI